MACAGWWLGTVLPLLRRGARFLGRGLHLWNAGSSGWARVDGDRTRLLIYRSTAEHLEYSLHVLTLRGPATSRPEWEAALRTVDAQCRSAWRDYGVVFDEIAWSRGKTA